MKNESFVVVLRNGERTLFKKEDILTPENVIGKFKAYLERIDKQYGKALPNLDVLWTFSFYLDFVLHRTDLETARKLHDLMASYLVDREGNKWD